MNLSQVPAQYEQRLLTNSLTLSQDFFILKKDLEGAGGEGGGRGDWDGEHM